MSAAPKALYSVGQVVAHTGLSRQTVHNYESAGLIRAASHTPGGHRMFGAEVFKRIQDIARMKDRGMTMEEIARS